MRFQLLRFTLFPLLASALYAATLSVVPPTSHNSSLGAPLSLTLVLSNDSAHAENATVPPAIEIQRPDGKITQLLPPSSVGATVRILPAQFAKIVYSGTLPPDLTGAVVATVPSQDGALQVAFHLQPATVAETTRPSVAHSDRASPISSLDSRPDETNGRFAAHEPIYYIRGDRDGGRTSRFQLSFKYRLGDRELKNVYLTYTTLSVWDHYRYSGPFRDISYMPGITWHIPKARRSELAEFDIWLGVEHESNGRGAPEEARDLVGAARRAISDSRSTNRAYIRPVIRVGLPEDDVRLFFAPKISKNFNIGPENDDLVKYRGYIDWVATAVYKNTYAFTGSLRQGVDGGSAQADFGFRLSGIGTLPVLNRWPWLRKWKPPGWFLLQYFEGHGETLLEYNLKRPSQWRAGYMLTPWFDARANDFR